ncbi:MAG: hypothetical protein P9L88_03775 [Candidatus Tantalella remota]|nr:hypothetical protein [Candidatus Tantalella remota]
MRVYRPVLAGVIITVMAVGYVHQKVEIVKEEYGLQKNRKYLSYLVDQNSRLMYNLSKLESPTYLLASLNDENIEFARINDVSVRVSAAMSGSAGPLPRKSLVGRIFGFFTEEAEARTNK